MSKPEIEVCLSPLLRNLFDFKGKNVVVIDVLRATSTIAVALANGAKQVIPVSEPEACDDFRKEGFLVAAERNGQKPAGFDFGNSPFDYPSELVHGKTLVLTTTNGTRVLRDSLEAKHILTGAFVNLQNVVNFLESHPLPTVLYCSGWKDQVNMEDTLFAGAVCFGLLEKYQPSGDPALMAMDLYEKNRDNLLQSIENASHYQRLAKLGLKEDIRFCMRVSIVDVLPFWQNEALIAR